MSKGLRDCQYNLTCPINPTYVVEAKNMAFLICTLHLPRAIKKFTENNETVKVWRSNA